MHAPYHGLVSAPFTPFKSDLSLNLDVIPAYAKMLRANGVVAAFVCGTTGEGPSLTAEERLAVAERWIAEGDESLRIIVHVGSSSIEDSQRFAGHAAEKGAAAIGCFPSFFFRSDRVDDLVDWCEVVARAGAPLPFYYYHIPSMTGTKLAVRDFLSEAAERISTLRGVKYTYEDLEDFAACSASLDGKFDCLFGRDELLLEGLKTGVKGAVGSTYNYAAPLYRRLIGHFERGEMAEAQRLQDRAIRMIKICAESGVTHLAATKALMPALGVDCGPTRLPLRNPTEEQKRAVRTALAEIGYDEFACQAVF